MASALMDHPNVARVFDGGSTDSGHPYFVMELVKGVPITQFCDEYKLSVHQRLTMGPCGFGKSVQNTKCSPLSRLRLTLERSHSIPMADTSYQEVTARKSKSGIPAS